MKLVLVTKLDKRNRAILKIFYDNVIFVNCDVTVIFPIYGQLEAGIQMHGLHHLHFH